MSKDTTYIKNTMGRKVIYVYEKNYKEEEGFLKIGDASISTYNEDFRDDSEYLNSIAEKRIRAYEHTSPITILYTTLAVDNNGDFFRDHHVHKVLKRSSINKITKGESNEWFEIDLETAKKAIKAVKNGESYISGTELKLSDSFGSIQFRPEQEDAITKTIKVFRKKDEMLWNAKMRFGKTLSALELIKRQKYKKTLIFTHRPIVGDGWSTDFNKVFTGDYAKKYSYASRDKGEKLERLLTNDKDKSFIYFASTQDLRGSKIVDNDKGLDKNDEVFSVDWDFIIIDEAHEGIKTELAQKLIEQLKGPNTKSLLLSGTPFNLLDEYEESQIYTWDYVMEQEAKKEWDNLHFGDSNPYSVLPEMKMFVYELGKIISNNAFVDIENKAFNFAEFFKVENEAFHYEKEVWSFLNLISRSEDFSSDKTNMPFSTAEYRDELRHTLWTMPSIASTIAMEKMLKRHPVFNNYNIANLTNKVDTDKDLEKITKAITDNPEENYSITLTVRKGTVGTTVKEWTGILVLNNTESASNYLQSIFRIQSPYMGKNGQKEKAYVFDFAPDRSLKMVSEAAKLNVKGGSLNTFAQEEGMKHFLNFLPIISIDGSRMETYSVKKMLRQLKRAQAEKAVKNGFDDVSIYNDELLKLTDSDLRDFENLRKIVGKTKQTKITNKVNINDQGLSEEEWEDAAKAEKRSKKERTPEQEAALEKKRQLSNQKQAMISILRGISIRIPLMIYGMDIDIEDDVTIDNFVDIVDDVSWNEFMPQQVTKELFSKYKKYYDSDIFIEAGRKIRRTALSADKLSFEERIEKITSIFSGFKNPDKETVLTPWRVVNMHLGETLGGYNFFDEDYPDNANEEGYIRYINHDEITNIVFGKDSKVLEINSKSGLYPLYMAYTIFKNRWLNEQADWNKEEWFSKNEQLWQDVLENNIYVLNKTPMARTITYRTLNGYKQNPKVMSNLIYVEDLTYKLKTRFTETKTEIQKMFGGEDMKFDVVVGNPPYQENDKADGKGSAVPLYNLFINLARGLNPNFMTLITPSVWFLGGKGLDEFRQSMLDDIHFRKYVNFVTAKDVFGNVNLRGGVNYFVWDNTYDNVHELLSVVEIKHNKIISSEKRCYKTRDLNLFISDNVGHKIINKLIQDKIINTEYKDSKDTLAYYVSERNPFGYTTTFKKFEKDKEKDNQYKIYGSRGQIGYVNSQELKKGHEHVKCIKVITPFANNIGTDLADDNLNTMIIGENEIVTETYLVIGSKLNLNMETATNLEKYLKTKLVRYLISLAKANQNGTRQTYRFVPIQDFTKSSDINWDLELNMIDKQLYDKYGLSKNEISFIESKIKKM